MFGGSGFNFANLFAPQAPQTQAQTATVAERQPESQE